jgi:hypothetical protein
VLNFLKLGVCFEISCRGVGYVENIHADPEKIFSASVKIPGHIRQALIMG